MLSVFIPVYNEAALLERSVLTVHEYLLGRELEHEIIVGSNGSTDETVAIGKRLGAEYRWLNFFHLPQRGPGRAFAEGVRRAQGELFVTLDVDLSSELLFLDYAHSLLSHCDMLVGSKTMGSQRRSPFRVLGSQLYILLSQLLFGVTVSDYSIGCKGFRRSSILPLVSYLDPWTGHMFELVALITQRRGRVLQIGIDCEDLRSSRFNLLHEGVYRYRHLFRCRRLLRDQNSWLNTAQFNPATAAHAPNKMTVNGNSPFLVRTSRG